MAKKNGKVAQAETNQPVEQSTEKSKSSNVFMNNVSDAMIRDQKGKDGKDYKSVSFVYGKDEDGKDIMASFLVKPGQVQASTKFGKGGTTVDNPGFKNILLGTPGEHYNISLNKKDAEGKYMTDRLTTVEIVEKNDAARAAYKAAKAAQANRETAEVAEPEVQEEAQMGE